MKKNNWYTNDITDVDKPNFLVIDKKEWAIKYGDPIEIDTNLTYTSDSTAIVSLDINEVRALWPEVKHMDMMSADVIIDKENQVAFFISDVSMSKDGYSYSLVIDEWYTYWDSVEFRENLVENDIVDPSVCTWKPGQESEAYCTQPRGWFILNDFFNIQVIMSWFPEIEANINDWYAYGTSTNQIGLTQYDNQHGYTHYRLLPPKDVSDTKQYYMVGYADMPNGVPFTSETQALFDDSTWIEGFDAGIWYPEVKHYDKRIFIDAVRAHSNNPNIWINTQQNPFGSPEASQSKDAIQVDVERVELKRNWTDITLDNKWILDYLNFTYISRDGYDDFKLTLDQHGISVSGDTPAEAISYDYKDLRIKQIHNGQSTYGTSMWWVLLQYEHNSLLDPDTGNVLGKIKVYINGRDEDYDTKGKQVLHSSTITQALTSTSIMFNITRIDKTYDANTETWIFNLICPDLKSTRAAIPDRNFWLRRGAYVADVLFPEITNSLVKENFADESYFNVVDEQFVNGNAYRWPVITWPAQPDMQYIESYDINIIKKFNHYKYDINELGWASLKGEERILWSIDFTKMSITSSYEDERPFPFMRFESIDFYKLLDFYVPSAFETKSGAVDIIIPADPKFDNYSYHIETLKKWTRANKMKDILTNTSASFSKELYDQGIDANVQLSINASGIFDSGLNIAKRRPVVEAKMEMKQFEYFSRIFEAFDIQGDLVRGSDKEMLKSGQLKLWLVLSRVRNITEHMLEFRKNGVPISGVLPMNPKLEERKYWNYLETGQGGNILESIMEIQGSQTIKNYFKALFQTGVRLWNDVNVWKDFDLSRDNEYILLPDVVPERKK